MEQVLFAINYILYFLASFWMVISIISEMKGDRERAKVRALWAIGALLFLLSFQGAL